MGWDQLLSIWRESIEDLEQQISEPPVACPNDGEILIVDPQGRLHCPFDGWIEGDADV